MIVRIDTLEDERLDAYAQLTEAQLRNKLEPEKGIFIAESGKVIERALEGGMQPLSLLMEEKWLPSMASIVERIEQIDPAIPVFIAPHDELRKLCGFELTRGALGAFRRPRPKSVAEACEGARVVAVLEDITNHTNVGAIFRSAAALGVDAVLITPACYDPLYRRAVRVSMGTVFQIPWARIGEDAHDWAQTGIPLLHELGFTTAALALSDNSVSLRDEKLKDCEKIALVLGSEGEGVSSLVLENCDFAVKLPQMGKVSSLNVAQASTVFMYEWLRQQQ